MQNVRNIGKWITRRRLEIGITQRELARRAKLAPPTIHKIEAAKTLNPSTESLVAIAKALEMDPQALLTDSTSTPKAAPARRWPLQATLGQIDALNERDQRLLDRLITTFVRTCVQLDKE